MSAPVAIATPPKVDDLRVFNEVHQPMELPDVFHRHVEIDGVRVFYREAGSR